MSVDILEKCFQWVQTLEDPGERFSIGRVIGQGNSSLVRQATDPDGKVVAIKIIEESDENLEDIYEEHSILTETCNGNPRFPIFFGAYRSTSLNPHQVWFVMELCEGGSVEDLLLKLKPKDRFLKEDVVAYILGELLQSLKELHDQSIIHRDVKAANVLITSDGNIKLTDFGLSRHVGNPNGKLQTCVGSPCWMAPEVVVSERSPDLAYDSRADVWSLGITAAELGDGTAPLSEVYAPRALYQVVQNPPPTLKKPADWSQLYNDFIAECLEKNPDHRPWSAELQEHTFLTEKVTDPAGIRASIVSMLEEVRNDPSAPSRGEVTIKSDTIKMDRIQVPQRLSRDDLATLHKVSEERVMETLHQRFAEGNIYTYLGDILIVLNPFGLEKFRKLYSPEVAVKYKYKARCDNAPHIYGVADRAYQDMLHHQEVQNIILTGETGSGKTTAGKHILWHLANLTASNKKMIERILKVETIIHAFGNASTIFNDSATRLIQYLELTFSKTGKLSGGIVSTFNLEKWRVSSTPRNQSNFHIFYYLVDTLCATDQTGKYHLSRGTTYEYLPECPQHVPEVNVECLRQVREAFNVLDFSLDEQESIVKILCAILLIGQVRFDGEDETSIINPDVVGKVASLLDVDAKKLGWTFTNFCVVTAGETVRGRCNHTESLEMRDSLARSLYCRLVDWIVNLVNTKLSFTRLVFGDQHSLGILDIPGFECFAQDNTLDQFLVNMTNEQLQFLYNQRVFVWEMQDYEKDELSVTAYNYHDNRELLDVVLSKPVGLLAYLDEETKTSNNDYQNFLSKIKTDLNSRFIRQKDEISFSVAHYSGQVIYDACNFVERNKNFLSPEMIQVMRISTNPTIVQLYSNQMTKTGNLTITEEDVKQTRWTSAITATTHQDKRYNTTSKGKFSQTRQMQTIASTTRNALLELLSRVSGGSAHFVRCIRSNLNREAMTFDRDLVRYQLRALAVGDSIRVRQLGYSRRLRFAEFLKRYKFLAFDFDETVEETRDNCRLLLLRLKMEGWALGKNKVFLRYYNEEFLSRLYETQVHKIIKVQSMMRAFLARKRTSSKFPRLALLRQGNSGLHPQSAGAGAKSSYSGRGTRNTTPVLYEGTEPCRSPGYNRVYSSKPDPSNVSSRATSSNIVPVIEHRARDSVSPSKLWPLETDEDRPLSPRDIARAFEDAARENERAALAGRQRPASLSPRTPMSPNYRFGSSAAYSPKSYQPPHANNDSRGNTNTVHPEIINPLEEFTNMAKKMTFEKEEGPYEFQGRLRKTNLETGIRQSGPQAPTSINLNIGGIPARQNAPSVRKETRDSEKITISPGFVVEGVCEEL
ncbi:unnamed protein product [Allacma fusca]|uniref:Neither inactivation nor afterpotential protein C n=1 Tax=Allacma fusca TaxID=39272 RepID=A0A8J2J8Q1_9HEXA|nr:unnamed protein product [Allacma fusca]